MGGLNGNPVKILWAGSDTHAKDLEIVVPSVRRIAAKYGRKVQFLFMGMFPDELRPAIEMEDAGIIKQSVGYIGACELPYYPMTVCAIAPDIAMIPVQANRFNAAKSNIKYLEMTMAGAAVVASDFGPYRLAIDPGVYGLTAGDGDWDACLSVLVESVAERSYYNKNSKQYVTDCHSWLEHGSGKRCWMDYFRGLADSGRPDRSGKSLVPPRAVPGQL